MSTINLKGVNLKAPLLEVADALAEEVGVQDMHKFVKYLSDAYPHSAFHEDCYKIFCKATDREIAGKETGKK